VTITTNERCEIPLYQRQHGAEAAPPGLPNSVEASHMLGGSVARG
jgi:hypothetical protein